MQKTERNKKEELVNTIKSKIDDRISSLENLISQTRASNNDTKSSMGDKYETGREMLQQEINNLQVQLNEVLKQQDILRKIQVKTSEKVENGALVKLKTGLFFIAVSGGDIIFENQKIMVISAESPLAKAMWGKSENEEFLLNGKSQQIEKIW